MAGWRRSFGLEACGVLASSRRPQRGRRSSLRQEVSLAGGFLRAGGCMEGRSSFWREVGLDVAKKQAVACRDRPCPELSFGPEAAAGGLVRLEGLKPAALTSGPEGRRWIWPSRGRHCAIRHLLAGGTNEDAHAPTTTPSPAGRSASRSEALPFLPDRSAPERALRCGVAVDGGCAAVGWWSRIGGGAAVWSRPVGCGKGCPG
jgi:hypothetical protein